MAGRSWAAAPTVARALGAAGAGALLGEGALLYYDEGSAFCGAGRPGAPGPERRRPAAGSTWVGSGAHRPMLRLVPPPGAQGQDPPKPAHRKGHKPAALFLTAEEARHTRVSLRNTARAFGGMDVLATVLGVPVETLYQASNPKRPLSGIFAIRISGAAGMSVEAVLTGAIGNAGRCSTCGSRAGDGRLAGRCAS